MAYLKSLIPRDNTPLARRSTAHALLTDAYDGVSSYSHDRVSDDAFHFLSSWWDFDFCRHGNGICDRGTIVLSSLGSRTFRQRGPSTIEYADCRFGRCVS